MMNITNLALWFCLVLQWGWEFFLV